MVEDRKEKIEELVSKLFEKDIITISAGTNVVRFLPPLIVKKEHIDILLTALDEVFNSF